MKTASTYLYDLVQTLTKSEKRYVKVQAGAAQQDYIQLMDALLAQKSFNEEKLIADYREANFIKHLAVNKRYLYELLLKSLARFGQKRIEDKVFEKINAVNVLIEKGLFGAAFSELRKGQKTAELYELFELQVMLGSIEKKLLSRQPLKKKDEDSIHLLFELESDRLAQLKNTNDYWHIAQQLVHFQTQFQKVQNQEQKQHLERITESPLFQNQSLATNFKSKLYFFQANSIYHFMLGNIKQAYEINKQFLDLLDAQPHFLRLYAERYFATLNNMLIDSLVIGKYDILQDGINRLDMILKRSEFKSIKNIASRIFRQRYLLLINWSLSQQDFEKALEWIPEIEKGLNRFGKEIEKYHRVTFYYLTAYLLFQNSRFEQALSWTNLMINDTKEDVVKEIYHFARVLNLLIHFELKNNALLESLLLSTPKYLRTRRAIYATEKALFRFLGKRLHNIDKSEKQKLILDFKNELDELFLNPKEKEYLII